MDAKTVRQSIDFIVRYATSNKIDVNFFGGEPMLNKRVLMETIQYAQTQGEKNNKRFSFSITTNGTIDCSDVMKMAKTHDIRLTISFDGPKHIHDKRRPFKNSGKGSYDIVARNIREIIKTLGSDRIKCKITSDKNDQDIVSLVKAALKLGLTRVLVTKQLPYIFFNNLNESYNPKDYQVLLQGYEDLLKWYLPMLNRSKDLCVQPVHKLFSLIYTSKCIPYHCLAGTKLFCITPEGELFPCHRFVGDLRYKIGDVKSRHYDTKLANMLLYHQSYSNHECRTCWARYLCFGNKCLQQNILLGKELCAINDTNFCEFLKSLLELLFYYLSLMNDRAKSLLHT